MESRKAESEKRKAKRYERKAESVGKNQLRKASPCEARFFPHIFPQKLDLGRGYEIMAGMNEHEDMSPQERILAAHARLAELLTTDEMIAVDQMISFIMTKFAKDPMLPIILSAPMLESFYDAMAIAFANGGESQEILDDWRQFGESETNLQLLITDVMRQRVREFNALTAFN
jgi:hypothetical protein